LPAPILVILFLSGGRSGAGEGDGSSNRRVAVYSLGRFLPRPRFSSSSAVDGGVRVCSSAVAGDASSAAGDASRRRQIKVPVGGLVSGRISGLLDFFLQRVGVFAPLPLLVDAAAAVVFGDGGLRFVLVLLLGKEWDLLCTSVSFPFWVGNCVAGCGIASFFFAVVACWFFICLRVYLWDYGAAEGGGGAKQRCRQLGSLLADGLQLPNAWSPLSALVSGRLADGSPGVMPDVRRRLGGADSGGRQTVLAGVSL